MDHVWKMNFRFCREAVGFTEIIFARTLGNWKLLLQFTMKYKNAKRMLRMHDSFLECVCLSLTCVEKRGILSREIYFFEVQDES